MKKIIFLPLVILFSGCVRTILFFYGVTPPKIISKEKINQKIEKFELKGDYSLSITENGFRSYFNYYKSANSLFIYSQSGKQILPKSKITCSSDVDKFIDYFKDSTLTQVIDTCDTNFFNKHFVNLNGSKPTIYNNKSYLAVVFWSSFSGKRLNLSKSAIWSNSLYKDKDVEVILVSLDPREFWPNFSNNKFKTKYTSKN